MMLTLMLLTLMLLTWNFVDEDVEDMNARMAMQGEEVTMIVLGPAEEVVEVAVAVVVEAVLGTSQPFEADHQVVDRESQMSGAPRWQQQTRKSGKRNLSLLKRTRKNLTLDCLDHWRPRQTRQRMEPFSSTTNLQRQGNQLKSGDSTSLRATRRSICFIFIAKAHSYLGGIEML